MAFESRPFPSGCSSAGNSEIRFLLCAVGLYNFFPLSLWCLPSSPFLVLEPALHRVLPELPQVDFAFGALQCGTSREGPVRSRTRGHRPFSGTASGRGSERRLGLGQGALTHTSVCLRLADLAKVTTSRHMQPRTQPRALKACGEPLDPPEGTLICPSLSCPCAAACYPRRGGTAWAQSHEIQK